ncbi:MAG: S-layer homology domain-containing protein, partial [Patescibacteria group bacterium]|nr:S-layer homology domain-containing protein [Patescibacteria group bacterium]
MNIKKLFSSKYNVIPVLLALVFGSFNLLWRPMAGEAVGDSQYGELVYVAPNQINGVARDPSDANWKPSIKIDIYSVDNNSLLKDIKTIANLYSPDKTGYYGFSIDREINSSADDIGEYRIKAYACAKNDTLAENNCYRNRWKLLNNGEKEFENECTYNNAHDDDHECVGNNSNVCDLSYLAGFTDREAYIWKLDKACESQSCNPDTGLCVSQTKYKPTCNDANNLTVFSRIANKVNITVKGISENVDKVGFPTWKNTNQSDIQWNFATKNEIINGVAVKEIDLSSYGAGNIAIHTWVLTSDYPNDENQPVEQRLDRAFCGGQTFIYPEVTPNCTDNDYTWQNLRCETSNKWTKQGTKKAGVNCTGDNLKEKISQEVCTYCTTNQQQANKDECNNHGTKYKNGTCDTKHNLTWETTWGACVCEDGYSGASCANNDPAWGNCTADKYTWTNDKCEKHNKWQQKGTKKVNAGCTGQKFVHRHSDVACDYCTGNDQRIDIDGCSRHGSRYKNGACDLAKSNLTWDPRWSPCACDSGYIGTTCENIDPTWGNCTDENYNWVDTQCDTNNKWRQTGTKKSDTNCTGWATIERVSQNTCIHCTANQEQTRRTECSNHGTQHKKGTCDLQKHHLTWEANWRKCICDTGYSGATCATFGTIDNDIDNDGMPDDWEALYTCLKPNQNDANNDPDQDGVTNIEEYQADTDPCANNSGNDSDSDNDGLPNWWEETYSCIDQSADDALSDPDNDNLANIEEFLMGTDPCVSDENEYNKVSKDGGGAYRARETEYQKKKRFITIAGNIEEKVRFMTSWNRGLNESFADIAQNHWAKETITYAKLINIIPTENIKTIGEKQSAKNLFRPDDNITRSETIAFLVKALRIPTQEVDQTAKRPFPDTGIGWWDSKYIIAAKEHDLVPYISAEGKFRPQDKVSRVEFLKMLYTALNLKLDTELNAGNIAFNDVEIYKPNGTLQWYIPYIASANRAKLISGFADGTFRPNKPITRAEATAVILKALQQEETNDGPIQKNEVTNNTNKIQTSFEPVLRTRLREQDQSDDSAIIETPSNSEDNQQISKQTLHEEIYIENDGISNTPENKSGIDLNHAWQTIPQNQCIRKQTSGYPVNYWGWSNNLYTLNYNNECFSEGFAQYFAISPNNFGNRYRINASFHLAGNIRNRISIAFLRDMNNSGAYKEIGLSSVKGFGSWGK